MHLRQKSPVVSAYHRCTSRIHEGNKRDASTFLSVRCVRELGRPIRRGRPSSPSRAAARPHVRHPDGRPVRSAAGRGEVDAVGGEVVEDPREYGQAAMSSAKRASSLTSMAPPGLTSAGDSQRARHVRRSSVSSKPSSAAALRQVGMGQEACREDEAGEEPFVPIDLEGDERAAHLAGAQLGQQRG
jgi:hypothetical protein